MKLIYCTHCEDLFRLTYARRSCRCGRCVGKYLDNNNAVVTKECVSVALGNGSFQEAVRKVFPQDSLLDREAWQRVGAFMAWVRPNQGLSNPHTRVVKAEEIA